MLRNANGCLPMSCNHTFGELQISGYFFAIEILKCYKFCQFFVNWCSHFWLFWRKIDTLTRSYQKSRFYCKERAGSSLRNYAIQCSLFEKSKRSLLLCIPFILKKLLRQIDLPFSIKSTLFPNIPFSRITIFLPYLKTSIYFKIFLIRVQIMIQK